MKNNFRDLQEAYNTSVVSEAKKPKPIKLDGSNLSFLGLGMDANGNKTVKVGANGKSFTIQTNANVPTAHKMQMSDAPSPKEIKSLSKEINWHVQAFGTDKQRGLASLGEAKGADYEAYFAKILKKYGAESPEDLSDDEKKKFFDEVDAGWDAGENETDVDEAKDEMKDEPEEDDQTDVEIEKDVEEAKDDLKDDPEEDDQTDVKTDIVKEEETSDEEEEEEEEYTEAEDDKASLDELDKELDKVKKPKSTAKSTDSGAPSDDAVTETITIDEKKYGLSQGMLNAFKKGADIAVKKVCQRCGFHMPQFSGRYPTMCPLCGDEFEAATDVDMMEKYGAYIDGKCVAIMYPIKKNSLNEAKKSGKDDLKGLPCDKKGCKGTFEETGPMDDSRGELHCTKCGKRVKRHPNIREGKFKQVDQDVKAIIDMFVQKRKSGEITSKDQFMKLFKSIKTGKNLPKGISGDVVSANYSDIAKGVADAFRKEGLKI
jgi:hypothetical protein